MTGDPFLNYFALCILIFVVVVIFYGIIAIHDIPHLIAKSRNHPHQDAIHAAGWVSLFTLHALWPLLWIWAMAYRPDRGWGFSAAPAGSTERAVTYEDELAELRQRIAILESRAVPENKTQPESKSRPAGQSDSEIKENPRGIAGTGSS